MSKNSMRGMLLSLSSALVLIAAVFLWVGGRPSGEPAPASFPEPTEFLQSQLEGEELGLQRRQWYESLHRTAPGVDWRAIERANWRQHLERRNLEVKSLATKAGGPTVWDEVGSWNQAGRVHQSAYDADTDRLFVGSSLGGVWRGTFDTDAPDPGNLGWTPIGDGVYGTSLQLLFLDGAVEVLLKTDAQAYSGDVHRSTDGGATWTVASGTGGDRPRRLVQVGGGSDTVFLIADDPNHWWDLPSTTRLYRSTNRGASFHLLRELGNYRGDIWTSRTAAGALYLLTQNRLEVSTDLGASWSVLGNLPWTGDSRAALTASEAGAPQFYAILQRIADGARQMFRSTDGGLTWEATVPIDGFWGDFTSLAASIVDPDVVLFGNIDAWRSTDGGLSFSRINSWAEYYGSPEDRLHADLTAFDFVPLSGGGEALFISTDGGLYHSADSGATVSNLSLDGLRISQYYSILTPAGDPSKIAAGSQDQGYQAGTTADGLFEQLISGDYAQLTTSDPDGDLIYSTYPGFLLVAEEGAGGTALYFLNYPSGETQQWLPYLLADPLDPEAFYFCATQIHRYVRTSVSVWTSTPLPFDFEVEAGDFVTALAIAPSDPGRWYAGSSFGRFWYSDDAGATWTQSAFDMVPPPQYLTGAAILVDVDDPDRVTIGGSGYGNPAVYRSTDGGQTFTPMSAGLPDTLVFDLAPDPLGEGDVYAAAESGPYRYEADTGTWQSLLGTEAPMTSFTSVESLAERVRFATYGRGVWDYRPSELSGSIFTDGFESGDVSSWTTVQQ